MRFFWRKNLLAGTSWRKNVIDLLPIGRADYDIISKNKGRHWRWRASAGECATHVPGKSSWTVPAVRMGRGAGFPAAVPYGLLPEKGHTACVTCTFLPAVPCGEEICPRTGCGPWRQSGSAGRGWTGMPPVLAKWLWLLFWLVIPQCFSATF